MSKLETKTLLYCQGEGCKECFSARVDASLKGDAASLPAALEAHKAGWVVAEGQILCPRCAVGLKVRPLH